MALKLITYDLKETIDNIHTKVKQTVIDEYGYSATSPNKNLQLPNTCLLKEGVNSSEALKNLKSAVTKHNGTLER